jgi:anti-sigma factor RsiW
MNTDLPRHAAAKVKRALDDVYQLTDDPGEMLRISLLASGICIGQASGILAGMMKASGAVVSEADAKQEILRLIGITVTQGGDAAWRSLQSGGHVGTPLTRDRV